MELKKYTQEEFDAFPVVDGWKLCPSGDYSLIKAFGERCSFGEGCSFGRRCSFSERCSFGEGCSFGGWCSFGERCSFDEGCICEFGKFQKLATVGGFGSESRTTYFFLLVDGSVSVRCGCFAGTLEAWESKVKETHGDSAFAKSYLLAGQAVRALWEIG